MPKGVYLRTTKNRPGDPLTPRQQEVLDFIVAYRREHHNSPSIHDIRRHFGVKPNSVVGYLCALESKGRISTDGEKGRAMLVPGPNGVRTCPHCDREIVGGDIPPCQPFQAGPELTFRQLEVFKFIRGYMLARGYPPTLRDIGEALGIRSPNGILCNLRALQRKGRLSRVKGMFRSIVVLSAPGSADCPVCRRPLPQPPIGG